ncbi:ABC transporter permease [Streptomyces uncialis]|uniref:ABC transporter permease n=1 Tax=Streptomyces uncialis TaxID=1048205 RepID=UPI003808F7B1
MRVSMRVRNTGTALLIPLTVAVVWWLVSEQVHSVFYPSLRSILVSFRETWLFAHFGSDIVVSLCRLLAGYLLSAVVGVGLGILLGRVRAIDIALQPAIQFARAIPAVALIPVTILLFGIGDASKILLIAFCCVFPILLNTIDGVRNVEAQLEDVGRSFRLTRWQRVATIQLPSALPQIFAGLRTALGLAFILGIVTEMTGSSNGIGFVTIEAQQTFEIPQMWSGMILLGLLGSLLNALFLFVERRALRWHHRSKAGI